MILRKTFVVLTFAGLLSLGACAGQKKSASDGTDSAQAEEYHADNDIAMTVRSVADAINVGEPLDTGSYNFHGVLTDGQGSPLYTNLHGLPGKWAIDAVSDSSLTIRNIDLGDLMADDLEGYLTGTLGIGPEEMVDSLSQGLRDGHQVHVYRMGRGVLRFEVHNVTAPEGLEAPLMLISLSANWSCGVVEL